MIPSNIVKTEDMPITAVVARDWQHALVRSAQALLHPTKTVDAGRASQYAFYVPLALRALVEQRD
jgi:hypothetical protein